MFGLFKKRSEVEVLQLKYKKLTEEAFKLSRINRMDSDKKYVEAQKVMDQIEMLSKAK